MAGSLSAITPQCASIFTAHRSSRSRAAFFTFKIKKLALICHNSKKKPNFLDQVIDYIEGGPKLRKWYGAPDLILEDGIPAAEDDQSSEARDAVLVTDGDSEIGQMIILSLIVKQIKVKALVKDKQAAIDAFGTYVQPMVCEASNRPLLMEFLRGVHAIICPNEGFLSSNRGLGGVQHIILLSQLSVYSGLTGIQALLKGKLRESAEQDEAIAMASGIPCTIIRAGMLESSPSRKQGFSFEVGSAVKGRLSMEDAAIICVESLDVKPETELVFEVTHGTEKVFNWKQRLVSLMEEGGQRSL